MLNWWLGCVINDWNNEKLKEKTQCADLYRQKNSENTSNKDTKNQSCTLFVVLNEISIFIFNKSRARGET